MDKLQRPRRWRSFDFLAIDPVAAPLQYRRSLVQVGDEKLSIAGRVKAAHRSPSLVCHVHILRVAVGAAFLVELRLEYIQQCNFLGVWKACFLQGQAAVNLSANQPNPSLRDKANSSHTAILMLVGVRETDNLVEPDGFWIAFGMRLRDDGFPPLPIVPLSTPVPAACGSVPQSARCTTARSSARNFPCRSWSRFFSSASAQ